jgi:hypothetical protein
MSDNQPRNFKNIEKSWIAGIYSPEYSGMEDWMVSVIDEGDEDLETKQDYYFDSEWDAEEFLEENNFEEILQDEDEDEYEWTEESESVNETIEVNDKDEEWAWEWEKSSYSSDTDKETYMRATLESPEKLKRKKWTVTLVIDDKENEYLYGTKEDAKKFIDGYGFSVDSDIDEDDNNTIKVGISVLGNKENNRVATYMSEEDGFLVKGSEEGEYIFERKALENEDKAVELANDWINKDGEFK